MAAPARMVPRLLLRVLCFLVLILPVLAYGEGKKKSKFLAAYPSVFKFLLFWWCIFVFAVMGVYILDHLLFRYYGPAKVIWDVEHIFKGSGSREDYWRQFADPSTWSPQHPVLQSADVRMVKCCAADSEEGLQAAADAAAAAAAAAGDEVAEVDEIAEALKADAGEAAEARHLQPVAHGPLGPGLGLILRHKAGTGPREGSFFCSRECTKLEAPEGEPWRMVMRTLEGGAGYPFLPNTEETEIVMMPPAEDGSVHCRMTGMACVTSRGFRWWTNLQPLSRQGAEAMLKAIGEEVENPKKKD